MKRRLLLTGATGTLGRHVLDVIDERSGIGLRALSRRERPAQAAAHHEWVRADLLTGSLESALRDVDVVLHLASAKGAGDTDLRAAERLLSAANAARVGHVVFVSIIGCDRIPLPFYASKVKVEDAVRACGIPWTIVRVAQFHSFVERLVRTTATLPVPMPIAGDIQFQPVDEREVAERLVADALGGPRGDAPEIAGPEILSLAEIARIWFAETGRARTLLPVAVEAMFSGTAASLPSEPWARAVLEGYRAARNTPAGRASTIGTTRFADWLRANLRKRAE